MYHRMSRRKLFLLGTSLMILSILVSPLAPASLAFITARHWTGWTSNVYYSIDPNIDANLGVAGAFNTIAYTIVPQWNKASWFGLTRFAPYDPNGNGVSTWNFLSPTPPPGCAALAPLLDAPAVTCQEPAYSYITTRVRTYLNTSGTWHWNNSGLINCANPGGHDVDVYTVVLHEMGHWYTLAHDPSHAEAVMWPNCTVKHTLMPDDRDGATQIYGPRTSWDWDAGYALGRPDTIAYALNVAGYNNNFTPPPELSNRGSEFGVTPVAGTQMEMMAGYARDYNYSYAYYKLFGFEEDSGGPKPWNYLTIKSGMKIRWFQYNYEQSTMGIDFHMTDGTNLRDYLLRDQHGIYTHPSARGNYPTGQWMYFEVVIGVPALVGKTIDQWLMGYDNGNFHTTQHYRAYFDNFRVEYAP